MSKKGEVTLAFLKDAKVEIMGTPKVEWQDKPPNFAGLVFRYGGFQFSIQPKDLSSKSLTHFVRDLRAAIGKMLQTVKKLERLERGQPLVILGQGTSRREMMPAKGFPELKKAIRKWFGRRR